MLELASYPGLLTSGVRRPGHEASLERCSPKGQSVLIPIPRSLQVENGPIKVMKKLASALGRHIEPGEKPCDNPHSTIPPDILVTSARPDIVLVKPREVILLEVTIFYNSPESLSKAKERKEYNQNYQLVLGNLDARGLSSLLYTIEIGALGHWLPCTCSALL